MSKHYTAYHSALHLRLHRLPALQNRRVSLRMYCLTCLMTFCSKYKSRMCKACNDFRLIRCTLHSLHVNG